MKKRNLIYQYKIISYLQQIAKTFHRLLSVELSWIINVLYFCIGTQTNSETNRQTAAVLDTTTFHTSI